MLLGMESTDSRMNRLARNEIYFRRDVPLDELSAGIEAVTNDNVVELASSWFQPDKLAMVLLGDLKGRKITREVFAPLANSPLPMGEVDARPRASGEEP